MKEVTKEEFKSVYFKYGKEDDGWNQEYWDKFYENKNDSKFLVELPTNNTKTRMMIVNDFANNEYRLFFVSIDEEEALFDDFTQ